MGGHKQTKILPLACSHRISDLRRTTPLLPSLHSDKFGRRLPRFHQVNCAMLSCPTLSWAMRTRVHAFGTGKNVVSFVSSGTTDPLTNASTNPPGLYQATSSMACRRGRSAASSDYFANGGIAFRSTGDNTLEIRTRTRGQQVGHHARCSWLPYGMMWFVSRYLAGLQLRPCQQLIMMYCVFLAPWRPSGLEPTAD